MGRKKVRVGRGISKKAEKSIRHVIHFRGWKRRKKTTTRKGGKGEDSRWGVHSVPPPWMVPFLGGQEILAIWGEKKKIPWGQPPGKGGGAKTPEKTEGGTSTPLRTRQKERVGGFQ